MSSRDPSLTPRLLAICALLGPITGCAEPERGHTDYQPWGGIELDDDDDGGEASGDEGQGDEGEDSGASAGDDAGDGPGDDGPADDGSGGEQPPPEEEPPGSPYVGGWDIGDCQDDIVPTGTGVGQVVPDLLLYDQFGDQVRLHDFCHEAVYIVGGAFWWSACATEASGLEALYDQYSDRGLIVLSLIAENDFGAPPTQGDLNVWAGTHGLSTPVLSDPGWTGFDTLWNTNFTPAVMLLAPGMQVVANDWVTEADIVSVLPH